jgi:3',5'-cyclic AMP phosphodiesterase CpdA
MDHVISGHRSRSFAICMALTLASCASSSFRPDTDLTVGINDETAISTDDSAPADVLLISDTHASNPMAPHALLSDGYYADTYVTEVAIRPPHMDQWGSRMVDWVLDQPRSARTIIHLGDAGNIGCVGEFARLGAIMQRRRAAGDVRHWYLAPGNHDSLVLGNWGYVASDPGAHTAWDRECAGAVPAGTMDKHVFLDSYTTAQGWEVLPAQANPDDDYACSDVATHDATATVRICRRPTAYEYESFIIQAITIQPSITMILLDTTQFRELPGLTHLGGKTGGIGTRQFDEVRRWLAGMPDQRIVLAGHHPSTWLDEASQRDLEKLIHDYHIVAYFSSHTHNTANTRLHLTAIDDDRRFLEINVGSLIDWPMEYEYLSIHPLVASSKTTELILTIAAASKQLEDECEARWGATRVYRGQPGYYTDYLDHNSVIYDRLRDKMFAHLDADMAARGIALPDDYATRELERGGRPEELLDRADQAEVITTYERCHTIWASNAESQTSLSSWNAALLTIQGWFVPPPQFAGGDPLRAETTAVASHHWLIRPR